jgi:cell division septal protein FtsQ
MTVIVTYYLFYSPGLRITSITLSSTIYIEKEKLEDDIKIFLSSQLHFPIDKSNYFIFGTSDLQSFLQKNYLVRDIKLDKKWPNSASITFDEDLSLITLANPQSSMWDVLNHKGTYVSKIVPYTYDTRLPLVWALTKSENKYKEEISIILALEQEISQIRDLFTIEQYTITHSSITVYTNKNFVINLPRSGMPEDILIKLFTITDELREKNILPEEYIHLQFSEKRAFYK